MDSLETQVGQIYISNKKLSRSFISLFSERIPETNAEAYLLLEVNILNPAAWVEYEKMMELFERIIRRNFRKVNNNAFENSISQINDELVNVSTAGQTSWVGKTNACIAVRQNDQLFISTAGKIHAYLFREKQLSDIADPNIEVNPLKTFQNFTAGKLKKNDFLIFTTAQLLNYVSVERLKRLISDFPLEVACESIAHLIKESADDTISFGTFILEIGESGDFGSKNAMKMLNSLDQKGGKERMASAIGIAKQMFGHTLMLARKTRVPKISLVTIDTALLKERAKKYADIRRLKDLPRAKKFFLASAAVFILLLIANIIVADRIKQKKQVTMDANKKISAIQGEINDANTAFIYNDNPKAQTLLDQAGQQIKALPAETATADLAAKLQSQVTELNNRINHIFLVQSTNVTTYTDSNIDRILLIGTNLYLINTQGDLFVPFDLTKKQSAPNFTLSLPPIHSLTYSGNLVYFTDKDGVFYSLDLIAKKAQKTATSLPPTSTGIAIYGTPPKVYTVNSASGEIQYSPITGGAVSSYIKDQTSASGALDLSIDHFIYVLTGNQIEKYINGQQKPFISQGISINSPAAKIYSSPASKYLYVLNPDAKRVLLIDKTKNVITRQYSSDSFTNLKDFAVDETNKIIYVLNDKSVLTIPFATN